MTDTPEFDLPRFLPYRMSVAAERLSSDLARRYRADFGISVAEWRVLAHLADAGAVSVRDLERRVNLEKSKASRAATRLEAEGYVTKAVNPDDRRLLVLTLTPEGRDLMRQLAVIARDYQSRLEALLGPHLSGLHAALDLLTRDRT
ncbi:MarR family transcriptional regulator [Rhodobacteraceae bacterium CCMM004]|nr:MarR family transcriptional regulator [Rhodobacteraceae bacterium CCMM004]